MIGPNPAAATIGDLRPSPAFRCQRPFAITGLSLSAGIRNTLVLIPFRSASGSPAIKHLRVFTYVNVSCCGLCKRWQRCIN